MNSSKLYDDKGAFTNTGNVQVGLTAMNYGVYMEQASKYAEEIKKIDADLANDRNNTKLIERREELLKLQQESISSAEDEKRAMADLVEEGINKELDALKDLIDAYEDSLESASDLYDFQKKVKNQTKEIASLQKQLQAYQGDTSEENRARLQKLSVDLSDAMEDLQETQYDQYIKDQKKLLGNLYDEYEQLLNARLDDIDALMREMIDYTNSNAVEIAGTIQNEATAVGYTISDSVNNIWNGYGNAVASYYNGITTNQNAITAEIKNVFSQVTKVVEAGNNIATKIAAQTVAVQSASASSSAPAAAPSTPTTAAAAPAATKKVKLKSDIQAYIYSGGPAGTKEKILHGNVNSENGPFEYLGEKSGYINFLYNGKSRWINSKYVNVGYSQGGFVSDLQKIAYDNGDDILTFNTLKRGEAILTPKQTVQFENLVDHLPQLQGIVDVSKHVDDMRTVDKSSHGDINISFGGGINIPIERVLDYNDFLNQLRKDEQFERLIQSMTIDRLTGGSKLAKKKYYWGQRR